MSWQPGETDYFEALISKANTAARDKTPGWLCEQGEDYLEAYATTEASQRASKARLRGGYAASRAATSFDESTPT